MPKTLEESLQSIIKMTDKDLLTKQDFLDAFQSIVEFMKAMRAEQALVNSKLVSDHKALMDNMRLDMNENMAKIRLGNDKMMSETMEQMSKEVHDKMMMMDAKMMEVKDGKDADETKMMSMLESKIPKEEDIINKLTMSAQAIRDALEVLNGDERLKVSAIQGLEDELKRIEAIKSKETRVIGGRTGTVVRRESLSSQCDGATRAFTLPVDVKDVIGVWGTEFPVSFDPSDWTFSGRTLTLSNSVNAPNSGSTLWALVETL